MAMIKGTTIILYEQELTGKDAFNRPIYRETAVPVDNVLISPMSDTEVLDILNLTGRRAEYQLALPKGDGHDWTDKKICFFGHDWKVIGDVQEGIEGLIPLDWNRKIRVEKFDG